MDSGTTKSIGIRAAVFAATLILSFAVLSFMPSARARRQNHFARAAADGNVNRMRLLHMAGANVNSRSSCCSPLFLAAGEGRLDAVRYLLDYGADVNAQEQSGRTAVTEAAFFGNAAVIKELALRGAEMNLISDQGTALDIAMQSNNASTIEVLKHYGAKRACEIRGSC
jgi:Ankyrin repeats (3 copies)